MPGGSQLRRSIQWIGLLAGPILAAGCYLALPSAEENGGDLPAISNESQAGPTASHQDDRGESPATAGEPAGEKADDAGLQHRPGQLSEPGRVTLAVMVWMAVWWLTEAVEISATAFLPVLLFPVLGASTIEDAAAPYADKLIFLFLGGFIIALSMQRWGLDRRIALLTLRLVGTTPTNMVGGFMLTTASLSAFVSNTATTAMMMPIALSVIQLLRGKVADRSGDGEEKKSHALGDNFAVCLMLGIAYGASIGGITTIIGTPPNAVLVGFLDSKIADPYQRELSFARWLLIGLPLSLAFLPIAWLVLTRVLYPIRIRQIEGGRELIQKELELLGPTTRGEWITLLVFLCTASCWILRKLLVQIAFTIDGEVVHPLGGLSDSGIAMMGALALFVLPVNLARREFVMNWQSTKEMPWGILVLFGGGLSLAAAVKANGVAEFIGYQASFVAGMPLIVVVLAVTTVVILLTELTSNLATTTTLLPVLAALAPALNIHPYYLIFPAALAASCAFMLPVATPPNAIVFGSGEVSIPQMCKAGLWFNLIGIALITTLCMLALKPVLGI